MEEEEGLEDEEEEGSEQDEEELVEGSVGEEEEEEEEEEEDSYDSEEDSSPDLGAAAAAGATRLAVVAGNKKVVNQREFLRSKLKEREKQEGHSISKLKGGRLEQALGGLAKDGHLPPGTLRASEEPLEHVLGEGDGDLEVKKMELEMVAAEESMDAELAQEGITTPPVEVLTELEEKEKEKEEEKEKETETLVASEELGLEPSSDLGIVVAGLPGSASPPALSGGGGGVVIPLTPRNWS